MYYSHPCSYCGKIFYTYNSDRSKAAETLYYGIKKHLVDYGEDAKEHELDDGPSMDVAQIDASMTELAAAPAGGYELK